MHKQIESAIVRMQTNSFPVEIVIQIVDIWMTDLISLPTTVPRQTPSRIATTITCVYTKLSGITLFLSEIIICTFKIWKGLRLYHKQAVSAIVKTQIITFPLKLSYKLVTLTRAVVHWPYFITYLSSTSNTIANYSHHNLGLQKT